MATSSPVSAQPQITIKHIGVMTDFSKEATTALYYAAAFARAYGAGITLAHSFMLPSLAYASPEASLVYQTIDDMEQSLKKRQNLSVCAESNARLFFAQVGPRTCWRIYVVWI